MTLQRAHGPTTTQPRCGGGCNRNAVGLIPGEVQREHGQPAVDGLIRELDLEQAFGLESGAGLSGAGR